MLNTPHSKDPDGRKELLFHNKLGVGFLVALFVFILIIGAYIIFNTKDIPSPDISDMTVPYPDVPEEENAFLVFEEVLYGFSLTDQEDEALQRFLHEEKEDADVMRQVLQRLEPSFQRLEEGVMRPRCVFPRPITVNAMLPIISDSLLASQLLWAQTNLYLLGGEYDAACDMANNHLRFAAHLTREPETLIQHLVGMAVYAQAYASVEEILHTDEVPVTELLSLRETLPSPDMLQKAHRQAIKSELNFVRLALADVNALLDYASISSWEDVSTFSVMMVISPSFTIKPNETTALFADFYREHVQQVGKLYSEIDPELGDKVIRKYMGQNGSGFPTPNFGGEMLVTTLYPAFSGVLMKQIHFQGYTDALRTWIALRAFQEANGALPNTLDELVPEFLPAVPLDPFDGKLIRYDAEKKILWLVGEDLVDQAGSQKVRPDERDEPEDRTLTEDAVWELQKNPKEPQPTPEPRRGRSRRSEPEKGSSSP